MKSKVLADIDEVLRGVDEDLRAAQNIRYRIAVDNLIDSAAADCLRERYRSFLYSTDIGAERLCRGHCWDSVEGRHLDCRGAYAFEKGDWGWESPYDHGQVHSTPNNIDVLDNPVDGIGTDIYWCELLEASGVAVDFDRLIGVAVRVEYTTSADGSIRVTNMERSDDASTTD